MQKRLLFVAIGIPTLYALALRLLFGIETWDELFSVMTRTFLIGLPFVMGALTVYFSPREKVESMLYRLFVPWIPVFLFFLITLALAMEGWACWLMILPVFLIMSSLGGLLGAYLKLNDPNRHLKLSLLVLLPFVLSPIEQYIGSVPATYEADTYIDIDAPAEVIWDHVTRVSEIPESEDAGSLNRFLGFPRPVKAELNFEGVGAYREAVFTKGLVFHETVTEYEDNRKMVFNIEAYPHEIPSTTLDEHVVIGGDYFDVLTGTYELEKIGSEKYRLHLSSRFEMNTTFNFYAGWWGKWIMEDIQRNILQVEKRRAEGLSH
ncbi:MAG: hypothetical protein R2824_07590 [Saprospiraceae bacterium]